MPKPGWIDVAGGKLTTYRLIGEQTVDRVFTHLGKKTPPCRTANESLLEKVEQIVPEQGATDGRGFTQGEVGPSQRVESGVLPPPVCHEVVEHYCRDEWAVHLDDVMIRRTSWHYYLDNPLDTAQQVAAWMAEISAWDAPRKIPN